MPKSPNQKLKLLYLMEILLQQTDERHPMTVPEMIAQLAQRGISAERKEHLRRSRGTAHVRDGHRADQDENDRVLRRLAHI